MFCLAKKKTKNPMKVKKYLLLFHFHILVSDVL